MKSAPMSLMLTRYLPQSRVLPLAGSESLPQCMGAGSRSCPSTGPSSTQVCSGACRQRSGSPPVRHVNHAPVRCLLNNTLVSGKTKTDVTPVILSLDFVAQLYYRATKSQV